VVRRKEETMHILSQPALATLFLGRLTRLVEHETQGCTPEDRALIGRAILSTYRDLRALGLRAEAERILLGRSAQPHGHA
jgi:hypothetical protein